LTSMFDGKSVLITGGTGSFGRKFVQLLLSEHSVRRLVVYSRDELKQYEMALTFSAPCMRYFIGDVRDGRRLTDAMEDVDIVIHAAALKHVGAAEYNPMECIKTNIHGTENVVHAALANDVDKVIALSSDKAASPISLYGATKLAADKLIVAANNIAGRRRTRFAVARYGNVVGSRGSVVPHFRRLINEGANGLPVTDERMTRFWITLDEGVRFVTQCFYRMQGGEIFVPKLPSVRIVDLAAAMAPHLPIRYIGIRPGEKIHEVMCPADDSHRTLEFTGHYVLRPAITFTSRTNHFMTDGLGEEGVPVAHDFEYHSGRNERFLSVDEIRTLNHLTGPGA
jgi:UDP-N-acetylglucosamine 4,6-dehydratase/5-epimerase